MTITQQRHKKNGSGRGDEAQYQRVQSVLRQRIQQGSLRPGQRLVRRTLALELNVSPIPVIEALHRLEQEGLVEHQPNVGARVRPLTIEQIQDDLVLREAIESQVARLLVGRLGPSLLDELRGRAKRVDVRMQRGLIQDERGMCEHADFHLELARLTGRTILLEEDRRVWSRRFMQLAWISATRVLPVPANWHRQLVEAIAGGDTQAADEAARFHVRRLPAEAEKVLAAQQMALEELQKHNWLRGGR